MRLVRMILTTMRFRKGSVGLLETNCALSVYQRIESWSADAALAALVTMFGGIPPREDDLALRLEFLDDFSRVWDYRGRARTPAVDRVSSQDAGGAARWQIPRLDLPAGQQADIVDLVAQLGLTAESTPVGTEFDHLLVIGTGRYSNLLRARYAKQVAAGRRIGQIVFAAASRRLLPSEDDAVASCAPGARSELELMAAAATAVFNVDTREAVEHARRRVDTPQGNEMVSRFPASSTNLGIPLTLVEAPSPDPDHRRATSADTFTYTVGAVGLDGSTCLMVTGQPFVTCQHFDALRTLALPYGIEVETVGFGTDCYDALGETDVQHPAKLLQEVRTTIRAARALWSEYVPPITGASVRDGDGAFGRGQVAARDRT
jgi:hypothetical protein